MSAVSHCAAAVMHGMEGFSELFEDVTVPRSCGWKSSPAIRSNVLRFDEVVEIEGLRVTSVLRTLIDLGRFVDEDTLEFAVEHALRGPDRRRPDLWSEALLLQLAAAVDATNRPGLAALRVVVRRRGNRRPMGSFAETTMGQGLRRVGVDLRPQPTIEVRTKAGRLVRCYFPDFADLRRGLLVEVDGRAGHEGDDNIDRDDHRQNELVRGFHVLRFHARRVLADPIAVAREIGAVQQSLPERPDTFRTNGATISLTDEGARLWR